MSVRKDMQVWVDIIRRFALKTLLLIGGPSYSQIIGNAADHPIYDPIGGNNLPWFRICIRTIGSIRMQTGIEIISTAA